MKLADAKALRDEIRAAGLHCIVPLGHGPDRYFARIFGPRAKPTDFHTREAWHAFEEERGRQRRELVDQFNRFEVPRRPRSPIEIMIDRACGLE